MEDFVEVAYAPLRPMHGAVRTLIGGFCGGCLCASTTDAWSSKYMTGDLQAGCYFASTTDAWSSKYINWRIFWRLLNASSPLQQMHGAVSTLIGGFFGGCLFSSTTDAGSSKHGDLQAVCLFDYGAVSAWSSKCMEQ